jgi:sugar lactone lactonase YvrE
VAGADASRLRRRLRAQYAPGEAAHDRPGGEVGPDHVAIGPDDKLYAAVEGGRVLRMEPDGARREVFASTGGRVLGFDFDAGGRLIAADAFKGLLAITPDRLVSVLADRVSPDDPIRYADAIVVAPDGTIYFTDASVRFSPAHWGGTLEASVLDIMEQSATGRVLAHDLATGRTRIVASGFSFANGIALAADGHTLLVTETGRYRVWKIDGRAHDIDVNGGGPSAKVLLDNLPGYPDNVMRGPDGRFWIGLFKRRDPAADSLAERPFLRKVMLRLPRFLLPLGKSYGHIRHPRGRARRRRPAGPEWRLRHDGRDRDCRPTLHPQPAGARTRLATAMTRRGRCPAGHP